MKKLMTIISLLTISLAMAEVEVPSIFCDNMILQQKCKNTFWGWAKTGESVIVTASWGATATATADDGGKWKLFLDTPGHGTGHSLTVKGTNTIAIKNVAIGEVWLCSGQSNMGWSMGNSFGAEEEAKDSTYPNSASSCTRNWAFR
jgi:sialate O-acetylesterase